MAESAGAQGSSNTWALDTQTETKKANVSALMNLLTIPILAIRVSLRSYFNFSMFIVFHDIWKTELFYTKYERILSSFLELFKSLSESQLAAIALTKYGKLQPSFNPGGNFWRGRVSETVMLGNPEFPESSFSDFLGLIPRDPIVYHQKG